jgi:hypothetical protein
MGRIVGLQRVEAIGDWRKVSTLELQNFLIFYKDHEIKDSDKNRARSTHCLDKRALEFWPKTMFSVASAQRLHKESRLEL